MRRRERQWVYIFPSDYLPTAATKYICNRMHPREHHPLFQRSNHVIHPESATRLKDLSGGSCSRGDWTQTHISCVHSCSMKDVKERYTSIGKHNSRLSSTEKLSSTQLAFTNISFSKLRNAIFH